MPQPTAVAVRMSEPGSLAIVPHAEPVRPSLGEVLPRIGRAGTGGSDAHILRGCNPFARYPRVTGHEGAGTVVQAGPDARTGIGPQDTVPIDGPGTPALREEACRVASPAGLIGLPGVSPMPGNLVQRQVGAKEPALAGSRPNDRCIPQVVAWLAEGRLQPAGTIPAGNAPHPTIEAQLDFA